MHGRIFFSLFHFRLRVLVYMLYKEVWVAKDDTAIPTTYSVYVHTMGLADGERELIAFHRAEIQTHFGKWFVQREEK